MAPNALEVALERATRDPGCSPVFYRQLLESQVVVMLAPVHDGSSRDGMGLITWTRSDGVAVIPFFSSLAVCKRAVSKPGSTVIVPARALFQAAQSFSMHMHLNPHHEFGREFVPEELATLLADGTIHQDRLEGRYPGEHACAPRRARAIPGGVDVHVDELAPCTGCFPFRNGTGRLAHVGRSCRGNCGSSRRSFGPCRRYGRDRGLHGALTHRRVLSR